MRDWAALGTMDFYRGLAMSSDVYFYYLSGGYFEGGREIFEGLGVDRLSAYARDYGLGSLTGIANFGSGGAGRGEWGATIVHLDQAENRPIRKLDTKRES